MKLETRVCSLELSKRLKELGVKQESLWWWVKKGKKEYIILMDDDPLYHYEDNPHYSAFTVAELGEMLPDYFYTLRDKGCCPNKWFCEVFKSEIANVFTENKFNMILAKTADTEANARAKMLVYLKEKGLIK